MKKFMTVSLALLAFFLFVPDLTAQRGMRANWGPGPGRMFNGGMYLFLKANQAKLKITDAQLNKIRDNMLKRQADLVQLWNKLQVDQLELQKLMLNEKRDYGKIKALMSKMAETRTDMMINRMKNWDSCRNILTKEQLENLQTAGFQWFQGMRGMRGFGRPFGGRMGFGPPFGGRQGFGRRMGGDWRGRFFQRRDGRGYFWNQPWDENPDD